MSTLFIGSTHGDEPIGVRALANLSLTNPNIEWTIGNPRAYAQNTRYLEADLNRCAPGNPHSHVYEKRRAAELLKLSTQFDRVIDIHGTVQDTGLFIIITNPSPANISFAKMLDVERVVIWPAITPDLAGPLSEYFPTGLEIECGPKDSPKTQKELERVLRGYMDERPGHAQQQWFEVYGELRGTLDVELKEFQEVTVDGETFAPLLIGTYQTAYGVTCYKLKRISFEIDAP